jgi:hypothetical protein
VRILYEGFGTPSSLSGSSCSALDRWWASPFPATIHDWHLGLVQHVSLQTLPQSHWHHSQVVCRHKSSTREAASHWFSQPCRCSSVSDVYPVWHCICCSASVPTYACSTGTSPDSS